MNATIIKHLARELSITEKQVTDTLTMLQEGNTVPFIARYRKEATGALDEAQILQIEKQYKYQLNLAERKEAVLALIEQQGKLTEEIKTAVMACEKLSQVEDLYKPYKQKKKTRAAAAINKGLQPLADYLLSLPAEDHIEEEAAKYITEEVPSTADALKGASDIIAEFVSDNATLRWDIKACIEKDGVIETRKKKDAEDEKGVYAMYYEYSEAIRRMADHRVMAINRGEKEKILTVSFVYDLELFTGKAAGLLLKGQKTAAEDLLRAAAADGLTRLLLPSIENEIRADLSEKAHASSIEVFSLNLEKLLSQPPLKGRVVMGFDPGFYNGCKIAVLDATGKMLTVDKVFPFRRDGDGPVTEKKLLSLIKKYDVKTIAIGNGTASRESEKLIAQLISDHHLDVTYAIVSEAGASVWSAQEAAREEFPDMAIEERSAVSIGRRLLDPLAELIKIDPKSIGVGQYQHDLPEKALTERLDEATMKVVNRVGADLNTASVELLRNISGLNAGIAREIVAYRNANGRFESRRELLKVNKLGPKAFTQCAGFLRITNGKEPLDATSIHPESYDIARQVMTLSGIDTPGAANVVFNDKAIEALEVDSFTLDDIKDAIRSPMRDYRDQFDGALLKSHILELSDLKVGDELSGTVRNVVDFGAFVDIGLHEDGLVHISRMAERRINHPSEMLSVNDIVTVYVFGIDEARHRVQLSLLPPDVLAARDARNEELRKMREARKSSGRHDRNRGNQNNGNRNRGDQGRGDQNRNGGNRKPRR
ncbi:MAG: Tex family protein [Lachnospiraceae bacterium]|nr:Tex family protein [Lachnospiraceae bacterium]